MLPFEAHLLAAGWPKNGVDEDGSEVVKEGSRPARLLHMVRRAERNLMSYERTGMQATNSASHLNPGPAQPEPEFGSLANQNCLRTVLRSFTCIP